jgi:hypothetical protein
MINAHLVNLGRLFLQSSLSVMCSRVDWHIAGCRKDTLVVGLPRVESGTMQCSCFARSLGVRPRFMFTPPQNAAFCLVLFRQPQEPLLSVDDTSHPGILAFPSPSSLLRSPAQTTSTFETATLPPSLCTGYTAFQISGTRTRYLFCFSVSSKVFVYARIISRHSPMARPLG